ncbi:uncharacterized protein LOC116937015 [Petromyzon marinus]|uniref:uncharacterized protein LOC116937015 n=1 Tax=Petromyzon marinus TaxID=7757 RepID=UPI003F6F6D4E
MAEMASAFLLLADSSIELGLLSQAEGYTARAEWVALCGGGGGGGSLLTVAADLQMGLARLRRAQGDAEAARAHLAEHVYLACERSGRPDGVELARPLWELSRLSFTRGDSVTGLAVSAQVVRILHSHLCELTRRHAQRRAPTAQVHAGRYPSMPREADDAEAELDAEIFQAEALLILTSISEQCGPSLGPGKVQQQLGQALEMIEQISGNGKRTEDTALPQ